MVKPELELHLPAGLWRRVNAPKQYGIWEQILAKNPSTGDFTALQRCDPGAVTDSGVIIHPYWEEIYILSGELTDLTLQATFTSGMYACRPPGMPHGPYGSDTGCKMIVFVHSHGSPDELLLGGLESQVQDPQEGSDLEFRYS